MDAVKSVLAMLGSIAGILGVVVAYLQYRNRREPVAPPPGDAAHGSSQGGPPTAVRALKVWLVVMNLLAMCVYFVVFTVILQNLNAMFPKADRIPDGLEIILPALIVAVTGMIMLPLGISWGGKLGAGEPTIRTKLLGVVAMDLCGWFVIVVLAFAVGRSVLIPDPVLAVAAAGVGFGVVADTTSLTLLLHPDTRDWVATGPHARAG
jgi:hypothetical protein